VAEKFPDRKREDGRHYAIDFTLEEIKTLRVHERVTADGQPEFPGRFPHMAAIFHIPTLAEEITLIQGMNRSSGRDVGVYIEPKSPAWHTAEGRNVVKKLVSTLADFGYKERKDKAYLQSFDMDYLEYARYELKTDLKLVQLIGEKSWQESDTDFEYLQTEKGLHEIARFADGIGPWLMQVVNIRDGKIADISDLAELAHRFGLFVHAYTLRADQLPPETGTIQDAVLFLKDQVHLDGIFTDHPDQVLQTLS